MLLWAWFTDVRLKNKHIPLSLRPEARFAKPPHYFKQLIRFRERPFHEKQTVRAWLHCTSAKKVENKAWPCWTCTSSFTPFPSQKYWAYELTYSTLIRVTISQKSETFSPNNNKYCKWQTKWTLTSSNAKRRQPKRDEGRERHQWKNTKVVQRWYLHPAQGLKTKGYLHKDGWSKPGQSTPSEQQNKNKETEQENSMNITDGPQNRVLLRS